jgi:hypothetical protein
MKKGFTYPLVFERYCFQTDLNHRFVARQLLSSILQYDSGF